MSFLFLSKLLPLFIYPLGLSCLLLFISLWLCFKRSRLTVVPVTLALIILLISSNSGISNRLIASLERQYPPRSDLPSAEAIVILGGATRNNEPPRLFPDLSEGGDRLLYGAKLYKAGLAPKIILTGGRINWYGGDSSEAESMATILDLIGIPRKAMILEPSALNTHENAVFTKEILERENIDRVLLVTSAAHMPRSLAIFRKQDINAVAAPTDFLVSDRNLIEARASSRARILSLIPRAENLDYTTQVFKEYIGTIIYRLRGWL
jgi:uncharacterized SAM-binding protein YcdF (DUF218 family)